MGKINIGIVILNYKNYKETTNCIKSIREKFKEKYQIVVVDNGSTVKNFEILERKLAGHENIRIVRSENNIGFARGNNIGIKILRNEYQCNFVLLLNSDTLIADADYMERLLECYCGDIGVIESNVWDRKGMFAQPQYFTPTFTSCLYLYFKAVCQYYHIYYPWVYKGKQKKYLCQVGCAIMLTPKYFDVYSGLYAKTFLYGEEQILLLLLKRAKLELAFCNSTYIIHNEGGSTEYEMLEGSRKKEKKVLRGYLNVLKASTLSCRRLIDATKEG